MHKGKHDISQLESEVKKGHLATDPTLQEPRRGNRGRVPNKKYEKDYVK